MQGADNLDAASELTEFRASTAIKAVQAKAKPEQVQNRDGSWPVTDCYDCGDPLGKRMTLGKIRCVVCQGEVEKATKGWRK